MEGRDISAWQGVLPPAWFAQWDFVIIRAFNEHGYPDTAFAGNWQNAKGRTRRGAYGWPIAGGDNAGLALALAHVAPDAEIGWWADYELGGRAALPTPDELAAYLHALETVAPGVRGFYSNLSELPRSAYLDAVPWWFANPSGNPEPRPAVITQYGIVDGLDANRADASALDNLGGNDVIPDEQMQKLAGWMKDQAHVVLHQLIGDHDPFATAVLAQWENDTRAILLSALKGDHDALAAAIVAKLPTSSTGISKADVKAAVAEVLHTASA